MKNSNWVCPKCGSKNVNNKSFDFFNFCKDCAAEWEAT